MLYSFRRVPMTDGVMTLGAWRRRLLSGSIRLVHHLYRSIRRIATIVVSRMISPAAFYAPLNIHGMTLSMWPRLGYFILWRTGWWLLFSVRARIRNGELDISEDYFLTCLYPKGYGNPNDVEKYFLRSSLLVKVVFLVLGFWNWFADYPQTFCAIFTSPSSSEAFEEQESDDGPTRKKQKTASQKKATKSTVASLLHMEGKVTPRAIAYAATLVLSSNHYNCVTFGNIYVYSSFLTCTTLRSGLTRSTTLASGRSITLSLITSNPTVLAAISRIPTFFWGGGISLSFAEFIYPF